MSSHFGADHTFIDVDHIDPGDDFARTIDERMRRADVVLALIGPRWLTATDADGNAAPPAGSPAVLGRHVDGALHGGQDRVKVIDLPRIHQHLHVLDPNLVFEPQFVQRGALIGAGVKQQLAKATPTIFFWLQQATGLTNITGVALGENFAKEMTKRS